MLNGSPISRTDLTQARIYNNGLLVAWKGDRKGRSVVELKKQAKTKRFYRVRKTKVQSACVAAWCAKHKKVMLFITVTFPFDIDEVKGAKVWDLLLNSLRNTYKIKHYVWVKERQTSGRLHYHIILDTAYIDITSLQGSFEAAVFNVCGVHHDNHNSVRLGPDPVVRSAVSVAKYLSKYVSKDDQQFIRKAYGSSELTIYKDYTVEELLVLLSKHSLFAKMLTCEDAFSLYFLPCYVEKFELISSG